MKFTILGFSQEELIKLKISLDEALILRYFVDFKDSGAMVKEYIEDDMYYWIEYKNIIEELPMLNISKDRVYRKLKHLTDVGILKRKTKKQGGTYSFYALGNIFIKLIKKSVFLPNGSVKIPEGYGENTRPGTVKTTEQNIHLLNNPSIKDNNIYSLVINYLNQKANKNYKYTTKKTQQLINTKMKEGFKLEDFYKVIDNKTAEWTGKVTPEGVPMENYLRPETLFGNKFEGYLNQKGGAAKNGTSEQCAKEIEDDGIGFKI